MGAVAYNPDDTLQAAFLAALGQGETGGAAGSATEGVGGTNLAGYAVDQYGFPIWQGQGDSHAAGTYQFEPGTWDKIAAQFNLNFSDPADQAEGAWEYAQQTDPNLYSQLQSGDYSAIQSALASVWPSVTGNASQPQGLANALGGAETTGAQIVANQTAANNASSTATPGTSSASGGTTFSSLFTQWGLVAVGAVIILVALWMLLSNQGIVSSPQKVGKSIMGAV